MGIVSVGEVGLMHPRRRSSKVKFWGSGSVKTTIPINSFDSHMISSSLVIIHLRWQSQQAFGHDRELLLLALQRDGLLLERGSREWRSDPEAERTVKWTSKWERVVERLKETWCKRESKSKRVQVLRSFHYGGVFFKIPNSGWFLFLTVSGLPNVHSIHFVRCLHYHNFAGGPGRGAAKWKCLQATLASNSFWSFFGRPASTQEFLQFWQFSGRPHASFEVKGRKDLVKPSNRSISWGISELTASRHAQTFCFRSFIVEAAKISADVVNHVSWHQELWEVAGGFSKTSQSKSRLYFWHFYVLSFTLQISPLRRTDGTFMDLLHRITSGVEVPGNRSTDGNCVATCCYILPL